MYRKLILDGINALNDIGHYTPYASPEANDRVEEAIDQILLLREKLLTEVPAPLIGLKAYTEGRASFERAGEISDLHIFGLREYCNDKGVDWSGLRIDEYYGATDVSEIEANWEKLDPDHKVYPINFSGNSRYIKWGLVPKGVAEQSVEDSFDKMIEKKASLLVAEFGYNFNKVCENFRDMCREELEFQAEYSKFILKLADGLSLMDSMELDYLQSVLNKCYSLLYKSLEQGEKDYFIQSINYLQSRVRDEYYWFVLVKDEEYQSFFKGDY